MSLIEVVGIEGYIQTTYLAVYPDKLMLIDSGCRGDVDLILNYITDTLQRPVEQLKTVLVSHMHPDHAGGAMLLRKKTGCQIVAGAQADTWYKGLLGRKQHIWDLALTHYVANRKRKPKTYQWYTPFLKPDIIVKDGDTVPNFEDWVILETPGHTNCDLSFWHKPSNEIYTADLILKIKNKFVSPYLISYPKKYKASLNKIKALQPSQLLLAHGRKTEIKADDFDSLIEKAPNEPRRMGLREAIGLK